MASHKKTSKTADTAKKEVKKLLKTEPSERKKHEKKPYDEDSVSNLIAPYAFGFLGVFLVITFCFGEHMSFLGLVADGLFGIFGAAMWLVPFAMFVIAARWKLDAPKGSVKFRFVCLGISLVFLAAFFALILSPADIRYDGFMEFPNIPTQFNNGKTLEGGGVVGAILCWLFASISGNPGCAIITVLVTALFLFLMIGITFSDVIRFFRRSVTSVSHSISEANAQRREEKQIRLERDEVEKRLLLMEKEASSRKSSVTELEIEDDDDDADIELDPKSKKRIRAGKKRDRDFLSDFFDEDEQKAESIIPDSEKEPEKTGIDEAFLRSIREKANNSADNTKEDTKKKASNGMDDIFCDDAVIAGAGSTFSAKDVVSSNVKPAESESIEDVPFDLDPETEEIENEAPAPEEIYEFPPIDLLPGNPNPSVFKVTEELTETAKNLVTTLANFNVKTKVMNISCGPTVTRFELKPEVGVKVRSIQNLADDIALHLRASSVRIEAPIPGKDAVGIEIPNKTVSTVYIKELIDSDSFRDLPGKLSVALGMDVSGTPVYMDIAKMPHLLIAGATGMGKSVCINSFIVSILYKARPDEVKLILIDPKKVEFAMYDSIPHLLVPVVTDPKKAAGSLAWAVNEMEHRFNLIEAAKCRDIKSYNAVCEKDTRFKKMSQIVIIIDELADLMMTARDEVETSICRLAQKARAAGMHLIIGTQRPSVDVITGVIKANVPSRIAFTVASQVDSRTILDTVGAENLVGKGDMLFAPVGCMKPTRVQGSFVGPDSVIEEITGFLRGSGIVAYDDDIQNAIEMEAMKCAEKKKGKSSGEGAETYVGSTDGFERDEMMLPALELGVDMGQISTSLVQRKLSLGYARAARIVDMLSEMGFVGPFEGSKPRKVLITREEYLEIKAKEESEG